MKLTFPHIQKSLVFATLVVCAFSIHAADEYVIGLTGAFTGGSSSLGAPMRDGIRFAVEQLNAAGGIGGKSITLVERDDEAKPARGVEIAKELVNVQKVCAVIGFSNTGVGLASHSTYQEAKIPVMVAVSAGTALTRQFQKPGSSENYVFRNAQNDESQVVMLVKEALDRRQKTKIAILADSTNYGQLGRQDLERELAKRGVTPVSVQKFNVKDVDMTPQLLRSQQAGADILIVYGIGPELAQIANGMQKLAWQVPMIGGVTLSMANFIQNAGPNAEGVAMPVSFIDEPITPRRKQFIEAYNKRMGVAVMASPGFVAQGYDAMLLLAAGIRQAGQCDGKRIKDALESLGSPVKGVIATYVRPFSPANHEAASGESDIPVMGTIRGGRVVFSDDKDKARIVKLDLATTSK
jgi:branched-chain amino acid transport system substrate-binding protein